MCCRGRESHSRHPDRLDSPPVISRRSRHGRQPILLRRGLRDRVPVVRRRILMQLPIQIPIQTPTQILMHRLIRRPRRRTGARILHRQVPIRLRRAFILRSQVLTRGRRELIRLSLELIRDGRRALLRLLPRPDGDLLSRFMPLTRPRLRSFRRAILKLLWMVTGG